MPIFKVNKQKLESIKEVKIDLEKDIQTLTENNLTTIFNLQFVCSEFTHNNLRIDTLAYDQETQSFVIIEYKKDRSFSVIDQGYAYLALMLNNKADFILEYNEKTNQNLKRENIDWSQSRVIFIANSFTKYQQQAINFQDLPIELWEVKKYSNNTFLYNQLQSPQASESIKTISKNKTISKVSQEVKKYTISDLFKVDWRNSRDLFESLRPRILEIDERIEEKFNKFYVGYKIGSYNLCTLNVYKSKLELDLVRVDKKDLNDPENKIKLRPWKENNWGKLCRYTILSKNDFDYAMFLIKQVYEKFYKE
ncbi:hypothetical protein GYA49_00205 [Candidatus Beckwithbacteria bacterium]|nr:hypothetical protein [Candidatus Beckwithbacteria bacterium]